ncbi:MAG: DUF2189 domain-containing protein [Gammaproteobacteria bacterium]|nr:DUF2189 domain-containing protein [Gammaproteobacteria bacterium]
MKREVVYSSGGLPATVQVKEITTEDVWHWLSKGWRDILRAPAQSLFYGGSLSLLSAAISFGIIVTSTYYLLPLLLAGFLLVAPFFGIGPYSLSQQIERGETPSLDGAFNAFSRNTFQILNMGLVLLFSFLVWAMLAMLIFIFFHQGITPSTWQGFVSLLLGTWNGVQLLVVGTYVGGVVAAIVFAVSVVSIPLLIDRPINVFDAIRTSWTAVRYNIAPMLLWAGLLVSIISFGFLTLYLGFVIGFPLAAHATWHAYRDLIATETTESPG